MAALATLEYSLGGHCPSRRVHDSPTSPGHRACALAAEDAQRTRTWPLGLSVLRVNPPVPQETHGGEFLKKSMGEKHLEKLRQRILKTL